MVFITEIENKDIDILSNGGDWIGGLTISWTIDPEYYADGINGLNPRIISIVGVLEDEDSDKRVTLSGENLDFEIKSQLEFNGAGVLYIASVIVDLKDNTIYIDS